MSCSCRTIADLCQQSDTYAQLGLSIPCRFHCLPLRRGHGPLSHAFESTFLPRALQRKREQAPDPDANDEASAPKDPSRQAASSAVSSEACKPRLGPKGAWHHEWASVWMLEHLIKANGLMPHFSERGLDEVDVHFIQELILGDAADAPPGFQWRGRPHKPFLYDIVANKCNGIDTDKVGPSMLVLLVLLVSRRIP